jgi:hypothetical protein
MHCFLTSDAVWSKNIWRLQLHSKFFIIYLIGLSRALVFCFHYLINTSVCDLLMKSSQLIESAIKHLFCPIDISTVQVFHCATAIRSFFDCQYFVHWYLWWFSRRYPLNKWRKSPCMSVILLSVCCTFYSNVKCASHSPIFYIWQVQLRLFSMQKNETSCVLCVYFEQLPRWSRSFFRPTRTPFCFECQGLVSLLFNICIEYYHLPWLLIAIHHINWLDDKYYICIDLASP